MFDFVRRHSRLMQFFLLLLILPAFVLFGFSSYDMAQGNSAVATVGSHRITQMDWDREVDRRAQMLRQQNPTVDSKLFDDPAIKYNILEDMLRQFTLQEASKGMKLRVTDAQLADYLASNPEIAQLRDANGKIDMARYRSLLSSNGLTPAMYEERVRQDLAARQLQVVSNSTHLNHTGLQQVAAQAYYQQREVQTLVLKTENYLNQITVTDTELAKGYKENLEKFKTTETADIQYIIFSPEALTGDAPIAESDISAYYQKNQVKFSGNEERRASHILIKAEKDTSAADKQKAKDKAQALLAQVRANPASFGAIAKTNSEDTGSAVQGGDLGFFGRGAMTKPFEDTVFSLEKGGLSGVVETEFGFHIIQLNEVRGNAQTLAAARENIIATLRREQGQKRFGEMREKFSNAVEDNDNLEMVAKEFNLTVRVFKGMVHQIGQHAEHPVLAQQKFVDAVFSPVALQKKHNTLAVDIGNNQLAAAHVTAHAPAATMPLTEVKDRVRIIVSARRAQEKAIADGKAKLAAWEKNPATASMGAVMLVSREQAQDVPPDLLQAILSANTSKLPVWVGVPMLSPAGYGMARITRVAPRSAETQTEVVKERDTQSYQQQINSAESMAFMDSLREHYKATIKVARPAPKTP